MLCLDLCCIPGSTKVTETEGQRHDFLQEVHRSTGRIAWEEDSFRTHYFDYSFDYNLDRRFDHIPDHDSGLGLDHSLDHSFDHSPDRNSGLGLDHSLDRSFDHGLDRNFYHSLADCCKLDRIGIDPGYSAGGTGILFDCCVHHLRSR